MSSAPDARAAVGTSPGTRARIVAAVAILNVAAALTAAAVIGRAWRHPELNDAGDLLFVLGPLLVGAANVALLRGRTRVAFLAGLPTAIVGGAVIYVLGTVALEFAGEMLKPMVFFLGGGGDWGSFQESQP